MMNLRLACCAAAIIGLGVTSVLAIPLNSRLILQPMRSVENVRLVCDEFGRCWQSGIPVPDYRYNPYPRYEIRPPTKWEQKGFCPPGQAKKGNC